MGEFLQRALYVDGYVKADDDTRTLLLLEASDFKNFHTLQIERNFFTFLQNSSYLFRFFEELSGELVEIGDLEQADTYGDYQEHIEILQELYRRYEKICDENRVADPIFLPKRYSLNYAYIKRIGEIEYAIEGYITNFEMKILLECAELIPVTLCFEAGRFNKKMQDKLKSYAIPIENGKKYRIDLKNRVSTPQQELLPPETEIVCEPLGERLLQAAFIKQKVFEFIESGIEPEQIAVVLPDENFARHLRRFDTENNFNFAMGFSLSESVFVEKISAVMDYIDNQSVENSARLRRIGAELAEPVAKVYKADVKTCDFNSIIEFFLDKEPNIAVRDVIKEELFYFEKILPSLFGATLKSVLYLFVKRLKSKSIDDVRGGKITVLGLLETRAINYRGVIVVDFNENMVPRKSEKDLFLNSSTRLKAGLPSSKERESLQKLYYSNLFGRAEKVAISYVESADTVPSRFLTQLGITAVKRYDDAQYADLLFTKKKREYHCGGAIEMEYDFTSRPLSATALKMFLTCKRKFYYRYIEMLKPHEIAKDMPEEHEIGTALHYALRDTYRHQPRYSDKEALKIAVSDALRQYRGNTALERYLHKLWMQRMDAFFDTETARFAKAEVIACEESLKGKVAEIMITGQVDRIDLTAEGLEVLDYKSGKYPLYTAKTVRKATDFQLEFYYLLVEQNSVALHPKFKTADPKSIRCGYYDLKNGTVEYEELFDTKLKMLEEYLKEMSETKRFRFDMTDSLGACRYCEYTHLCQREL
jgi:RecB family exonuclease